MRYMELSICILLPILPSLVGSHNKAYNFTRPKYLLIFSEELSIEVIRNSSVSITNMLRLVATLLIIYTYLTSSFVIKPSQLSLLPQFATRVEEKVRLLSTQQCHVGPARCMPPTILLLPLTHPSCLTTHAVHLPPPNR